MALKLSLGQYYPANSPIHRLDPRVKLVCALVAMVSVFFILTPAQLVFGWVCALAALLVSRVPARKVLQSLRPIIVIVLVLGLLNLVMVTTGDTLAQLGPVRVTTGGVRAAFLYSLRLPIAVLARALVLLPTTPTPPTDAFDSLLSPLARLGLPAHEIAMVFSLMLRFVPTLADETQAILDAQTSRGGALAEGSLSHRIRSIVPVGVALLASSRRHADGLSRALDARCYEGGAARSHWHPLKLVPADALGAVATAAYLAILLLLG